MSNRRRHDPDQDQDQDQDQKQRQAELQAQLQGQLQGQAQGQAQGQFALQSSYNENDNDNDNENKNENSNENKVENDVDNKLDNSVDNEVKNEVENKVENHIENVVETKVDVEVKVDLDLDSFTQPSDNDVIDIDWIKDIDGSVVMPDVVNQALTGDGNQFNIDQVNNIVDKDFLWDPDVKFTGDGELKMDGELDGGESKIEDVKAEIGEDGSIGDTATATSDAIGTYEAFTQNIVMGANIQFNSIEMTVAGNDLTDDHSL